MTSEAKREAELFVANEIYQISIKIAQAKQLIKELEYLNSWKKKLESTTTGE